METETSFGAVVSAVPALAEMCSLTMTSDTPGSGLKMMRLVCKQLRSAMLRGVQGYTLCLDGNAGALLSEMSLLQTAKLARLCVVVMVDSGEVFPEQLDGFTPHSLHLRCFMLGLGAAIKGISRLQIQLQPVESGSYHGIDELLLPLAEACPLLQVLQVAGDVGRSVLTAFGASCSSLLRLEVMEGVTSDTLSELHLVLPNLTQCIVTAPPCIDGSVPEAEACCLALMSCTTLTYLDVGECILTIEMWRELPAGLRSLHCALQDECHEGLQSLTSLHHLECHCNPATNYVDICSLVSVLRRAPALKSVEFSNKVKAGAGWYNVISQVVCGFGINTIPELVYLHDRLLSGLEVTSAVIGGGSYKGVNLGLWHTASDDPISDAMIADYLSSLPPLPAITGLILSSYSAQKSILDIIQAVVAVFPNLDCLVLNLNEEEGDTQSQSCLKSGKAKHLAACTSLEQLSLDGGKIDPMSLIMLCSRMPSLKVLRLKECDELSSESVATLQKFLTEWDIGVQVVLAQNNWT